MDPSPLSPIWISPHLSLPIRSPSRMSLPALLVRGEDVFGAGADRCGPARGHGLQPRVEVHALRTVNGVTAEYRAVPATETVERHRHGNGDVDADHAHLHAPGEIARRIPVAREHRDTVSVVMLVDQVHGIFVVASAHHAQDRPENLFAVDGHVPGDVIEE